MLPVAVAFWLTRLFPLIMRFAGIFDVGETALGPALRLRNMALSSHATTCGQGARWHGTLTLRAPALPLKRPQGSVLHHAESRSFTPSRVMDTTATQGERPAMTAKVARAAARLRAALEPQVRDFNALVETFWPESELTMPHEDVQ